MGAEHDAWMAGHQRINDNRDDSHHRQSFAHIYRVIAGF